ncbi:type I restriction enzyme subunit R domain-containing protein [Allochromatium palmeri]|uniref:DUF3387 domain-containing protein n=1 Tax=Allochromatium palmeri TaxID=231048 RepID=A0A6N8EDE7_9GAMM|nr:type I restriction enzyme endonuclease domain-containing protein [Allochromatium palmeri]MTW22245.1 DUF3387 domain-containing protein [Allochromatium palmeri]
MTLSPYLEDLDSKIPAIQVLEALGWTYLTPDEALELRGGRLDPVVLTGILRPWLEKNARFETRGHTYAFSPYSLDDGVEILIVIDRLLTGFDEPRNLVLYIDKPLQEHSLLQAIARVNRLYEEKDTGLLIDYRGVLGKLNAAMHTYDTLDTLAEFDPQDVDLTDVLIDIAAEIARLPQRHTDLWAIFKEVKNKKDKEALERHLAAEDVRADFYAVLRAYLKTLAVALGSEVFFEQTPEARIAQYKQDLKFFVQLRRSVQQRYAEKIDYSAYEQQVRKLMDAHIQSPDVSVITPPVDIFNVEAFQAEVERVEGKAAKADTIASRLTRTITEKMDEDPVFYQRFVDLVQQAIDDYRAGRIDEVEYLQRMERYHAAIVQGQEDAIPAPLRGRWAAQAFFGVVGEILGRYTRPDAETRTRLAVEMALTIDDLITAANRYLERRHLYPSMALLLTATHRYLSMISGIPVG